VKFGKQFHFKTRVLILKALQFFQKNLFISTISSHCILVFPKSPHLCLHICLSFWCMPRWEVSSNPHLFSFRRNLMPAPRHFSCGPRSKSRLASAAPCQHQKWRESKSPSYCPGSEFLRRSILVKVERVIMLCLCRGA